MNIFFFILVGKSHCLDNNLMVPLPARLCFECGRSCRKAPLIACDYCPLYFHQDCLDPPLTAFPIGRWMCPNHPNHFIDQNLLTSCRVTERIKLWDKYANQRIDQHAVKLDFLRKASTANPLFRTKVRLEGRMRVKVPPSVKYHYENPSHLDLSHFNQETSIRSMIKIENEQQGKEKEIAIINNVDTLKKSNYTDDKESDTQMEIDNLSCKNNVKEGNQHKKESDEEKCINKTEAIERNDTYEKQNNIAHTNQFTYSVKEGVQLLERPVLEALARQRLEQILNPEGENYNAINCQVKARAALFSLSEIPKPPVFMIDKTMIIGNGPTCDLILSGYGNCSFISSKHAVIFFDEVNNIFPRDCYIIEHKIVRPMTPIT